MVRAPHALKFQSEGAGILGFEGPTSRLRIRRLTPDAYEVRYDLNAYRVEEKLEATAGLLYDPEFRRINDPWKVLGVSDGIFRAGDGNVELSVTLDTGLVELKRNGISIHGGEIGSSDNVLPRYPLRVVGSADGPSQGKFNFLMDAGDHFFGLGDKAGDPNRKNRRFLLHSRDALGYRASYSDPLYKSIPFIVKWNPDRNIWMGLAMMAPDVISADFGVESPYFYSFLIQNGPYRYVVLTGDSYHDILRSYADLSGRPAFPPIFTFGFLGSSMDYTEPDDAPERVQKYLNQMEDNGIPCEGLYLSSGYLKAENGKRYAFEWNRRKFPNPGEFLESIRSRGYHVAANIKPGILVSHPRYDEYASNSYLVPDAGGLPYKEYYWGEDASFWDFTSKDACQAWSDLLEERLINPGCDGIWNDNNELEMEDVTVPSHSERSTFALQMSKISYEKLLEKNPGKRPWIISRSGGIGIQRYARTWTGDNTSDWESLRFNNLMGLSMGMSGLPYVGHDIGGFFGDHPSPELFLRWCQSAVFQSRFVIHSWNDDGRPTELLSYEEYKEDLKSLVLQHYEFMPYIYSQAYISHCTGSPLHRSPMLEFPNDRNLRSDDDCYLFGDSVYVIPSMTPGLDKVTACLPSGTDWYDPENGTAIHGGQEKAFGIRRNRTRHLIRTGSTIPAAPGAVSLRKGWFETIELRVFPGRRESRDILFEDDGASLLDRHRWNTLETVILPEGNETWTVTVQRGDENDWQPDRKNKEIRMILPEGFRFAENGERTAGFPPPKPGERTSLIVSGAYHLP